MSDPLSPGSIIAERFRLDRLLGEGGMGAVWAATHVVTQKRVAVKVLKGAETEATLRRFLREARAASAVRHTHIVQVHDVLMTEGNFPMMVMDLCVGESLASKLARQQRIALPELAEILVPILSALGTAHAAGIVHRDLKPDNLFLDTAEDGRLVPKVLDFGIAKLNAAEGQAAATAALTETGAFMGTPYYMSPEQVFGEKDIDHRSDVWAIGVILYECLTGVRPFEGSNFGQILKGITSGNYRPVTELTPELPRPIVELIQRMLQVRREQRPIDLREPYETLRLYAQATHAQSFNSARIVVGVDSTNPDTLDPASNSVRELGVAATALAKPSRGRRWLTPALAGSAALAVTVAGLWFSRDAPNDPDLGAAGRTGGTELIPSNPTTPATVPTPAPPPPSTAVPSASSSNAPTVSPSTVKSIRPNPHTQPPIIKSTKPPPDPVPTASNPTPQNTTPKNDTLPGGVVPVVP